MPQLRCVNPMLDGVASAAIDLQKLRSSSNRGGFHMFSLLAR
jgi:hypothetical protein